MGEPMRHYYNEKVYKMHYDAGIFYNYPKCCVEQFSKDAAEGVLAIAVYRQESHGLKFGTYHFGYVPCDSCIEKLMKKYKIRRNKK